MNRQRGWIVGFLVAAAACEALVAQPPARQKVQEIESVFREAQKVRDAEASREPLLESLLRGQLNGVSLKATSSKTEAALLLELGKHAFLKVAGPLDEDGARTDLLDLSGLTGKAKLELGANWDVAAFDYKLKDQKSPTAWETACEKQFGEKDCDLFELPRSVRRELGEITLRKTVAISGTFSHESFNYLTPDTLSKKSETHDQGSFKLGFGVYPDLPGLYFAGLTASYESSYSAQAQRELCSPFGSTTSLECRKAIVGAPTQKEGWLADFEMRIYPRANGSMVIQPKISYDFEESITAVDVPILFISKAKNRTEGLNGGVALGWNDQDQDFSVRVFVGQLGGLLDFGRNDDD